VAAATPPPAATPVPTPAATPVVTASKASAALKIVSAKARRVGRKVTLTLRGTAAGAGAVKLTALGHTTTARLVNGVWKATLKLKTTAKRVTVRVTDAGDATHSAGTARKTVKT
jgi:hypothetical protein